MKGYCGTKTKEKQARAQWARLAALSQDDSLIKGNSDLGELTILEHFVMRKDGRQVPQSRLRVKAPDHGRS